MPKNDEVVDENLIEEQTESRPHAWTDDEFGIFEDDDPAPADRRRDPLRKYGSLERAD